MFQEKIRKILSEGKRNEDEVCEVDCLGPCKKYVTPKIGIFDPPLPMSHFVIFWFDPPPPHVTHRRVTISDGEKQLDNILIYVHRMITYGQNSLIKRKSCPRCKNFLTIIYEFYTQKM